MKANLWRAAVALACLLLCAGCAKAPQEVAIASGEITLSGDDTEYIAVADGEHKLIARDDAVYLTLRLERVSPFDEEAFKEGKEPGISDFGFGNLTVEPRDAAGLPVVDGWGTSLTPSSTSDYDKLAQLLRPGADGPVSVVFKTGWGLEKKDLKAVMRSTSALEVSGVTVTYKKPEKKEATAARGTSSSDDADVRDALDAVSDMYSDLADVYSKLGEDDADVQDALDAMNSYSDMLDNYSDLMNSL